MGTDFQFFAEIYHIHFSEHFCIPQFFFYILCFIMCVQVMCKGVSKRNFTRRNKTALGPRGQT